MRPCGFGMMLIEKHSTDYCLILLSLGKGCVYSFDPVGSYERETYRAGGSASALLQPLLDNQVCYTSYTVVSHRHVNDQALSPRGGSRLFLRGVGGGWVGGVHHKGIA